MDRTSEKKLLTPSENELFRRTIIEECKSVVLKHLEDAIGSQKVVSIILYGSVARNEETYSLRDGKLCLESDIDLVAVIRSASIIKDMIFFRSLSQKITRELKNKFLLSEVSLIVATEKKLLHSRPSVLCLELKLGSQVIYGKDLSDMLFGCTMEKVSLRQLTRYIFPPLVRMLQQFVMSELADNSSKTSSYQPVLRSMRKITTCMIRAVIIKDCLPINPFKLNEIKIDENLVYGIKNAELLRSLFKSYETLRVMANRPDRYLKSDVSNYWTTIIDLFNLTLEALTGNKQVWENPSEDLLFEQKPNLIRRLKLAAYVSPRFLGIKTMKNLVKAVTQIIVLGPDHSYLPLYRLFLSIPSILKIEDRTNIRSKGDEEFNTKDEYYKSFKTNFEIWNLSSCIFADQF